MSINRRSIGRRLRKAGCRRVRFERGTGQTVREWWRGKDGAVSVLEFWLSTVTAQPAHGRALA